MKSVVRKTDICDMPSRMMVSWMDLLLCKTWARTDRRDTFCF